MFEAKVIIKIYLPRSRLHAFDLVISVTLPGAVADAMDSRKKKKQQTATDDDVCCTRCTSQWPCNRLLAIGLYHCFLFMVSLYV